MTVQEVGEVKAGPPAFDDGAHPADVPAFCRVRLTAEPTMASSIGIEVWLPADGWNGRLLGTGNGGFGGSVNQRALAAGVRQGYATANNNLGTSPAKGFFTSKQTYVDWASLSTHLMTVATDALVRAYYGRPPQKRYFSGCSSGGQEGLMESQRYPSDYDGILAGAPAHDRVRLHVALLWNWDAVRRDGKVLLSPSDLSVISKAVANACPSVNGVVLNPAACRFDPATLLCKEGATSGCLDVQQAAAVAKLYSGPRNTQTNEHIYPGLMPGGEQGWRVFLGEASTRGGMPYTELFATALPKDWHGVDRFDFNNEPQLLESQLSGSVDAVSPNLDAFRARGSKLLMTHGWSDPVISPVSSVQYLDALKQRYGSGTDDFARLFLIPGEEHCGGGPGPSHFEGLALLRDWVENRHAPDSVRFDGGRELPEVLACAYPGQPVVAGQGVKSDAANGVCKP